MAAWPVAVVSARAVLRAGHSYWRWVTAASYEIDGSMYGIPSQLHGYIARAEVARVEPRFKIDLVSRVRHVGKKTMFEKSNVRIPAVAKSVKKLNSSLLVP